MTLTIISGASRGIGKAIADDLWNLDSVIVRLNSKILDLENFNLVQNRMNDSIDILDGITRVNLILCAAQIGTYQYSKSINLSECEKLFKINVLGNLALINAIITRAIPVRIVWFAGGGAAFPYPEFFGYSLSKVAVVRAVENISKTLEKDSSIIALAPGAVETDMLKTVLDAGCEVRTKTDISEPVNFVRKFVTDEIDSLALNGMFLHVRDDLSRIQCIDISNKETHCSMFKAPIKDLFRLRRIE